MEKFNKIVRQISASASSIGCRKVELVPFCIQVESVNAFCHPLGHGQVSCAKSFAYKSVAVQTFLKSHHFFDP